MKDFDHVMVWVFALATIAVVVGSGKADGAINAIVTVLTKTIGVITSPASK